MMEAMKPFELAKVAWSYAQVRAVCETRITLSVGGGKRGMEGSVGLLELSTFEFHLHYEFPF